MTTRILSARDAEAAIAALASRQHGVVTRAQLIEAGFGGDGVDWRLKLGRLRALHRGIYMVGPLPSPYANAVAATLACGASAVLSHRSASGLWQVLPHNSDAGAMEVIIPHDQRHERPGIRVHRVGSLRSDEVTRLEGIPLTTPARTLYDIAAAVSARELERALAEAFARRLTTRAQLEALLTRHRRGPGTSRLRALLQSGAEPAHTRSEAEELFLKLIRKAQLPVPEVNVMVGAYEVDFYWRALRFVAEIDGFASHSSQRRFESDRRRDSVLAASGVHVMRVTWRQITDEPEAVLVRLTQALTRAAMAS